MILPEANWDDQQHCIDDIIYVYYYAKSSHDLGYADLATAWDYFGLGNDHTALNYVLLSMLRVFDAFQCLIRYDSSYTPAYAVPYYLANYAGGAVTWEAICEAWVKDDFKGKEWTIACIDQMRKLMWDMPFDIKWAAKPDTER